MRKHAPARLDPRAPLVYDIRELGRRPGSMRRLQRAVPAPPSLSVELIGVVEGTPVQLDLRVESVVDGVLVSGTATAGLSGTCGRCLVPLTDTVQADIQELYAFDPVEDGDEIQLVQGDLLDLEPTVRDAVVLALPLNPLCSPMCPGLCPICGGRLAELPAGHDHPQADPRWAALGSLINSEEN